MFSSALILVAKQQVVLWLGWGLHRSFETAMTDLLGNVTFGKDAKVSNSIFCVVSNN